jgi:hypothetical protein
LGISKTTSLGGDGSNSEIRKDMLYVESYAANTPISNIIGIFGSLSVTPTV